MAYKEEFGEAVREMIGKRKYRQISPRANISPAYIADMVQGRVPSREKVISFARACDADPNPLLAIAGYELIGATIRDTLDLLHEELNLLVGQLGEEGSRLQLQEGQEITKEFLTELRAVIGRALGRSRERHEGEHEEGAAD